MNARYLGVGLILALAACGGSDTPELMNVGSSGVDGPDEFAIITAKPLVQPEDMSVLPSPTPGGVNRADATPQSDLIVALGGNPAALTRSNSGDGALLAYTGRYGVSPGIRAELAAADLEFRRENDGLLLERLFNVTIYYETYEPFELDQYAELERLRQAGVRTSSVPPDFSELVE